MLHNRLKNEIFLKKMSENNNGNTKNGVAFFLASLREKNISRKGAKSAKKTKPIVLYVPMWFIY